MCCQFWSSSKELTLACFWTQTEWLSKHVSQLFVQSRKNVFHFQHIQRCCTRKELARLQGPQVVLASGLDLETSSFSLDLFAEWAGDSRNAIILTQKARASSTAQNLIDLIVADQPRPSAFALQLSKRVPLQVRRPSCRLVGDTHTRPLA